MRNRPLNHKPAAKMGPPENGDIVVTRTIDVPRGFVFHMWTDSRHVANWWGPQGRPVPRSRRPAGNDRACPPATRLRFAGERPGGAM